jgi:hypothetical protein
MFLSALLVFFQAQRVLPLIDFTYQLENAYRIYLGQLPYKDFVLVVAPGTYFLMALLMKIFGLSNAIQLFSIMIISSLTILLTFSVIKKITNNKWISILISAPLVFCGYSIYPFPNYDINATFFILLSMTILIFSLKRKTLYLLVISGVFIAFPPFFKQNTGLIYTFLSLFSLFVLVLLKRFVLNFKQFFFILLGTFLVFVLFLFWLVYNNLISDFVFQNFVFPSQTRPIINSIKLIFFSIIFLKNLFIYFLILLFSFVGAKKLKNTKHKTLIIVLFIFILFFIRVLTSTSPYFSFESFFYLWYDITLLFILLYLSNFSKIYRSEPYFIFLPIIVIGVCFSSFLSQGVIGSSYGIWPLFTIMIAFVYKYLNTFLSSIKWQIPALVFTFLLSFCLSVSLYKNTRLAFIPLSGKLQKASASNFDFIGTPGNWISEMEELFLFIENNIPKNESFISIPGEDPIYFATKRTPQLSFFSLNNNVCPFSEEQIISKIKFNNIKWILWKTNLQLPEGFVSTIKIKKYILLDYHLIKTLNGYTVYKKNI